MKSERTPEEITKEIDVLEKLKNRWLGIGKTADTPTLTYEYICERIGQLEMILENSHR